MNHRTEMLKTMIDGKIVQISGREAGQLPGLWMRYWD